MKRRTLLRATGASGLAVLAGCTAEGPGGEPGNGTDEPTDSSTPSPSRSSTDRPSPSATRSSTDDPTESSSPSTTPGTEHVQSSFTVTNRECGTGKNSAEGSSDGSTVTVSGVVDGSDTCHSAKLADATVEDGTLTVAVATYVPQENEGKACSQCIVDIAYEAAFEFEGDTPDRAVVTHDGERVAEFSLSG